MSLEECFIGDGILFNSGEFSGLRSEEARKEVRLWLSKHNAGGAKTTYHLRDWLISRQRYWGPPIPMIFCEKCGWQPVPEEDLPVLLPEVKDWKPKGTGKSPLASVASFVHTTCPNCAGKAVRETDVSDTFLDSSWYFFRYISTELKNRAWNEERGKKWLPVTMYIGGAEHSVLHLLYTRFLTMVFKDLGLTTFEEPFPRFYAHGLLIKEGSKMSKSKGNIVVPDSYIKKYGADTLRTYLMFLGPFSQGGDFYDSSIGGVYRFLRRVENLVTNRNSHSKSKSAKENLAHSNEQIERKLHQTIKKVSEDMEALRFNTAIAALMELLNYLQRYQNDIKNKHLDQFLLMLAPFAPHLAEELWSLDFARDKQKWSIHQQSWPSYDPKLLVQEEVTIVVQVNGKVRDTIKNQKSKIKNQKSVEELALQSEKLKRHLEGKTVKKVIYVAGKIINFVTD